MNGLFITGTDTGVGKTVVAAGILRWLRGRGVDAVPMKPVQTGAKGAVAPDLSFCLAAAGLSPRPDELELMAPYRYEPACSPHLAGRMAGSYPQIGHILTCAERLLGEHDFLLVEGAGGILVPLDETNTMLDLMREMAFPVLLVSRIGLGTINHTLLSVGALRVAGLEVFGAVINTPMAANDNGAFIREDNPRTIEKFGEVEVLGTVRHLPGLSAESRKLWEQFAADMPGLEKILRGIS